MTGETSKRGRSRKTTEAGNDWLSGYLPYLLYRVSGLMNARLQSRLSAMGVGLSQWRVLSVLRSHGRVNLSQIISHTLMEQPTVSRVVANLERDGFVDRKPSATDSRVIEVTLTEKGMQTFEAIAESAVRYQRNALDGLSAKQLGTLREILANIETNILLDR